jgi:inner membrane protein
MNKLKSNLYFKIGTIVIIALLLLIPTSMIRGIIYERESTQEQAIQEVSSKWGEAQTIKGPIMSLPFMRYAKETDKATGKEKLVTVFEKLHILPSKLKIVTEMKPERRYRGVYEIVVYNSIIKVSGEFNKLNFEELDIPASNFDFTKARLNVGIDDLRGIEKQIELNWNNLNFPFSPGVSSSDNFTSGINAQIALSPTDNHIYTFSFELKLKGSQQLYFTPVGKETDINVASTWTTPSFNGSFLPDENKVTKDGFTAHWNVLNLNRNYPQSWVGSRYNINYSAFGVDLILPVDNYQKSHRSIKYAILFIGLTFLVFFFIEVFQSAFIHPIQYILVGIALVIFYTLLLSISEYLKFNMSFFISALATLILISGYVKAILKSTKLTAFISGLLSILYIFIFVIIQLEDFALLIGSIGVFIILALIMYFSRKIDWYSIGNNENNPAA